MISGEKYDPYKSDIWSAGVVLFAMICGYLPFEDPNTSKLYKKIIAGKYVLPKFLSFEVVELMKGVLDTNPVTRFDVE
jgi:5'-AMP-activated protein kinase catalytic alpha subunit